MGLESTNINIISISNIYILEKRNKDKKETK